MLPLPDGGTLAGSGEGIVGGIRQALGLVVSPFQKIVTRRLYLLKKNVTSHLTIPENNVTLFLLQYSWRW
jgi:hypothetical protein